MKRRRLLRDPLRSQLRQLMPVNLLAVAATIAYVLLRHTPLLTPLDLTILISIAVHSGIIVLTIGWLSSKASVVLYRQPFTRDQIWHSKLLASALSAVLVCGTAWLLMVSGLRSLVQDHFFQHPYFPMIAPEEFSLPWIVLPIYAMTLASMHYVWIRAAQPDRGSESGWMLMVLSLALIAWTIDRVMGHINSRSDPTTVLWTVVALHLPATIVLLYACRRLHRTVEVQP